MPCSDAMFRPRNRRVVVDDAGGRHARAEVAQLGADRVAVDLAVDHLADGVEARAQVGGERVGVDRGAVEAPPAFEQLVGRHADDGVDAPLRRERVARLRAVEAAEHATAGGRLAPQPHTRAPRQRAVLEVQRREAVAALFAVEPVGGVRVAEDEAYVGVDVAIAPVDVDVAEQLLLVDAGQRVVADELGQPADRRVLELLGTDLRCAAVVEGGERAGQRGGRRDGGTSLRGRRHRRRGQPCERGAHPVGIGTARVQLEEGLVLGPRANRVAQSLSHQADQCVGLARRGIDRQVEQLVEPGECRRVVLLRIGGLGCGEQGGRRARRPRPGSRGSAVAGWRSARSRPPGLRPARLRAWVLERARAARRCSPAESAAAAAVAPPRPRPGWRRGRC